MNCIGRRPRDSGQRGKIEVAVGGTRITISRGKKEVGKRAMAEKMREKFVIYRREL